MQSFTFPCWVIDTMFTDCKYRMWKSTFQNSFFFLRKIAQSFHLSSCPVKRIEKIMCIKKSSKNNMKIQLWLKVCSFPLYAEDEVSWCFSPPSWTRDPSWFGCCAAGRIQWWWRRRRSLLPRRPFPSRGAWQWCWTADLTGSRQLWRTQSSLSELFKYICYTKAESVSCGELWWYVSFNI